METTEQPKFSLEQRLFHAIHENDIHSPSVKEFKECHAFLKAVRATFGKQNTDFDVIIDVAGGHGALAAMLLILTSATKAVVVDPAEVGQGGVERAWKPFYAGKSLSYRTECLRTGLPAELDEALATTTPDRILVVACHACQHLSEETLEIACGRGVHAAVMPCCQKDLSPGSSWKAASKNLSIPVAKVMDILVAGKMMASGTHDVRMKQIDASITPQNRIILCRALRQPLQPGVELAHARLETAYRKAHSQPVQRRKPYSVSKEMRSHASYALLGFAAGAVVALSVSKR